MNNYKKNKATDPMAQIKKGAGKVIDAYVGQEKSTEDKVVEEIKKLGKTTVIGDALKFFQDTWGPVEVLLARAHRIGLPIISPLDKRVAAKEAQAIKDFAELLQESGNTRIVVDEDKYQEFLSDVNTITLGLSRSIQKKVEELRKGKHDWTTFLDAEGKRMAMQLTQFKRLKYSVEMGQHVMLLGEPGTAKTSIANAIAFHLERKLFCLNVAGMTDVSQMESERIIKSVNGASESVFIPSQLIRALEAAMNGQKVVLRLDELPRVSENSILNPLMELMSHGVYYSAVFDKEYRVSKDNFVIISTANFDPGFNFSGNNRKGLDDALKDRHRMIRAERPGKEVLKLILEDNVQGILTPDEMDRVADLYELAKSTEEKRLLTVRSILNIAVEWGKLNPEVYKLSEVVKIALEPGCREPDTLSALVAAVESKGR
jgi:hypothetical protein